MDRYEVGCPVCGVHSHESCFANALQAARYVQHGGCRDVTIYDRMAHYGRPCLWTAAGSVTGIKPPKSGPRAHNAGAPGST